MPIRVAVDRGRSKSSPATASGPAARPWRRDAEAPVADAKGGVPLVQRLAPVFASKDKETEAESVRAAARSGLRTPGTELPFAARIRKAFQPHDLQGVTAHLGPAADASADEMQAEAYAAGEHVVFRGRPDLRTVAHEVAHVVQQRAGARPERGIGRQGDAYERNADAVARAVEAGKPAVGLPPPLPPLWATGPVPVQRIIRSMKAPDGTNRYYSSEDPDQELFATRSQARARESEILLEKEKSARRSSRPTRFMGSTSAQQVAPRKGVHKSPEVDYPDKPSELALASFPVLAPLHATYSRSAMGAPMRQTLIDSASAKSPSARTAEDESMIASPSQNMVDANISMNHKLADSSIATLMQILWLKIRELGGKGNLSDARKRAILRFMLAMADKDQAKVSYRALMTATDESEARKAAVPLKTGIDLLSLSPKNLRFGKADINTLILYAFDPNQDPSGIDTPLTEGIRSAVRGLATAGLIPPEIVDAALSQARRKSTSEPMSSSSV